MLDYKDPGVDPRYCDAHSRKPVTLDDIAGHLVDASNALDTFHGETDTESWDTREQGDLTAATAAIDTALRMIQRLQESDR